MTDQLLQTQYQFNVIAVVDSCYKQKFAIPRQSGLAPSGKARIRLLPPYDDPLAVKGLEQSSHIWVQFVFHQAITTSWRPSIRPPRLGGNEKLGVFATRSSHRPNSMGLSVVKLDGVDTSDGVVLNVSGIDLLDQTPVLDIKPYVPYVDRVEFAENGFAQEAPSHCPVMFSRQADQDLRSSELKMLVIEMLQQDPRPAYQSIDTERVYGTVLNELNLRWRYLLIEDEMRIEVIDLKPVAV